jgi:hypothetical protein
MLKTYKNVSLLAVSTLILPISTMAAVPTLYGTNSVFDGWNTASGTIDTTVSCSGAGVSCTTISEEAGFKYEEVVTPAYSYLRMIMTDNNATGTPDTLDFTSETFIPYAEAGGGFQQGLASKQVIRDNSTGDNFLDIAEIQKGNLRQDPSGLSAAADMWSTRLSQTFDSGTGIGSLSSAFSFENYNEFTTGFATIPDTANVIGKKTSISQRINTGDTTDPNRRLMFELRQNEGYAGTSTAAFANPTGGYLVKEAIVTPGSVTLNAGAATPDVISWVEGDAVSATWIATSSNIEPGMVELSYENVTATDAATSTTTSASEVNDLGSGILLPEATLNPFDWDPANFGPQPVF